MPKIGRTYKFYGVRIPPEMVGRLESAALSAGEPEAAFIRSVVIRALEKDDTEASLIAEVEALREAVAALRAEISTLAEHQAALNKHVDTVLQMRLYQ